MFGVSLFLRVTAECFACFSHRLGICLDYQNGAN